MVDVKMSPSCHSLYMVALSQWSNVEFIYNIQSLQSIPLSPLCSNVDFLANSSLYLFLPWHLNPTIPLFSNLPFHPSFPLPTLPISQSPLISQSLSLFHMVSPNLSLFPLKILPSIPFSVSLAPISSISLSKCFSSDPISHCLCPSLPQFSFSYSQNFCQTAKRIFLSQAFFLFLMTSSPPISCPLATLSLTLATLSLPVYSISPPF